MVGKVEEDFVEMAKQEKRFEELSDIDKLVIGQAVRIEIPFCDQYNMRRIAELLRGYAELLDFWSRRTDLPARVVLLHLRSEAKAMNKRVREITGHLHHTQKGKMQ
jgi:hypothetical protein